MAKATGQYGTWYKQEDLGSGGFGQVSLWENVNSHEKIAIKVCRQLKAKHLQRWRQEVAIMRNLDHPGLVQFRQIPSEIESAFVAPNVALGMEYCENGDLRRLLSQSQNCCGLSEPQIRAMLGNIGSAINYLHDKKIVHRDIKPENIVLKSKENGTLAYKIIDLGYAKDLSDQTCAQSFVGTPHYLAPEFVGVQPLRYTATVDFWSFGLVAFECITGRRPFYPMLDAMRFLTILREKKKDFHICTVDNEGSDPQFSSEIPQPHHLNPILAEKIRVWLQCMVLMDPTRRGKINEVDDWFSELTAILNDTVIEVFNTQTQEVITIEADEETSITLLKTNIAQHTNIQPPDQILLFKNGEIPNPTEKVLQQFETKQQGKHFLFLFSHQHQAQLINWDVKLPDEVSSFLGKSPFNPKHMKRVTSLATNFISEICNTSIQSMEACAAVYQSMDRYRVNFHTSLGDLRTRYLYFMGMVRMYEVGVHNDIEACKDADEDPQGTINMDEIYTQLVNDRDQVASWTETVKREAENFIHQSYDELNLGHKDHWTEFFKQTRNNLTERLKDAYQKHEVLRKRLREASDHERRPTDTHSITGNEMVTLLQEHIMKFVYASIKHLKIINADISKRISAVLKIHERLGHLIPGLYNVKHMLAHRNNELHRVQRDKQVRLWSLIAYMRRDILDLQNCLSQFSNDGVEDTQMNQQHISTFDSFISELHEGINDIASLDWNFGGKHNDEGGESTQPATVNHEDAAGDVTK
uniref:IkappaB kinase n=1 Tax=Phallusia mammillata TaxID=59560 RepID=A0A6F9DFL3_9ASCI|nr:IKK-alpha/beta inhibitor of nuclear factor kappa-B kinase subunit beta [Phallusia mammillata]